MQHPYPKSLRAICGTTGAVVAVIVFAVVALISLKTKCRKPPKSGHKTKIISNKGASGDNSNGEIHGARVKDPMGEMLTSFELDNKHNDLSILLEISLELRDVKKAMIDLNLSKRRLKNNEITSRSRLPGYRS